jgi:hypothetical protein
MCATWRMEGTNKMKIANQFISHTTWTINYQKYHSQGKSKLTTYETKKNSHYKEHQRSLTQGKFLSLTTWILLSMNTKQNTNIFFLRLLIWKLKNEALTNIGLLNKYSNSMRTWCNLRYLMYFFDLSRAFFPHLLQNNLLYASSARSKIRLSINKHWCRLQILKQ